MITCVVCGLAGTPDEMIEVFPGQHKHRHCRAVLVVDSLTHFADQLDGIKLEPGALERIVQQLKDRAAKHPDKPILTEPPRRPDRGPTILTLNQTPEGEGELQLKFLKFRKPDRPAIPKDLFWDDIFVDLPKIEVPKIELPDLKDLISDFPAPKPNRAERRNRKKNRRKK